MRENGMPGVAREDGAIDDGVAAFLLTRDAEYKTIGQEDIRKASAILQKYKDGKANLEMRIVEDELWWELRHWEAIRNGKQSKAQPGKVPEPSSAWLFNAILNKHADAMDNYPEPIVLPREQSDADSARVLSEVLPVLLEYNDFEQVYSDNWWEKLKHGTAAYGVFWNNAKENGLGDVDICQIDLLKLFWEPGVTDIQDSRNLFIVDLVDEDILDKQYPQYAGKMKGNAVDVKQYIYDDTVDVSGKSVVVDWYYKAPSASGGTVLHYCKFVGDTLLYASENDPDYRDRGFYDHGQYPVVLDCMFPEKGTPVGFGYVAICKDPQLYIDKLSANILETSMMSTKKRFFISDSTAINEEEFLDWSKPLVHVQGELDDRRIKEITCNPLNGIYVTVANMKIEELKDTAANRDVNSGSAGSGITAAAAIAALQEAGNKASRDMISASYRAHIKINRLCIELMRQFYDESRSFRITGQGGVYHFSEVSNRSLADQPLGKGADGTELYRRPVFDLKIKAQKKNPFSRMEQNETAKELYRLGFFAPDNAQAALNALDMMEFEGIDAVRDSIRQGQTMMNVMQQMQQENAMLKMLLAKYTENSKEKGAVLEEGGKSSDESAPASDGGGQMRTLAQGQQGQSAGDTVAGRMSDEVMKSRAPMTSYGQRLAEQSRPQV